MGALKALDLALTCEDFTSMVADIYIGITVTRYSSDYSSVNGGPDHFTAFAAAALLTRPGYL